MKNFIQTLKNIWHIEDLRSRILTTLALVLIYRFGSFVVLPGVDPSALAGLKSQAADGVLGLLDMFSGGAFSNASVFCSRYYAVHFCIYCGAIVGYGCALFSTTTA